LLPTRAPARARAWRVGALAPRVRVCPTEGAAARGRGRPPPPPPLVLTTLTVNNPDQGVATEDLPADYSSEALEIGFNSKFLRKINLNKIKKNYFFEQDILFYTLLKKGRVKYLRNEIFYKDEISSLAPIKTIVPFLSYHFLNFFIKIGSVFNQKD
jgi:hypothetical protein